MTAPLEDLSYIPKHPPIDGQIPEVVAKWGPRSQLRWFDRFNDEVNPQKRDIWEKHYCVSLQHKGFCCISCQEDGEVFEDQCCCKAIQ